MSIQVVTQPAALAQSLRSSVPTAFDEHNVGYINGIGNNRSYADLLDLKSQGVVYSEVSRATRAGVVNG